MKFTSKPLMAAVTAALSFGIAATASARSGHNGHHSFHALHHSHGYWQAHHRHSSPYSYCPSYHRSYSNTPLYDADFAPSYYGSGGHGLSVVIAGHHHHHH